MADKLMVISVDGEFLVACSPVSGIELARKRVNSESTDDHIAAAELLVFAAFQSLNAEGYPRASSFPWVRTAQIREGLL